MTIYELRQQLKMTEKEFADMYRIPEELIQKWESGEEETPEYVIGLLERVVAQDRKTILRDESSAKLYEYMGHKYAEMKWDIEYGFLSEITDGKGRCHWLYKDDMTCVAICMEDGSIIDKEKDPEAMERLMAPAPGQIDFEALEMESMLKAQSFLY